MMSPKQWPKMKTAAKIRYGFLIRDKGLAQTVTKRAEAPIAFMYSAKPPETRMMKPTPAICVREMARSSSMKSKPTNPVAAAFLGRKDVRPPATARMLSAKPPNKSTMLT